MSTIPEIRELLTIARAQPSHGVGLVTMTDSLLWHLTDALEDLLDQVDGPQPVPSVPSVVDNLRKLKKAYDEDPLRDKIVPPLSYYQLAARAVDALPDMLAALEAAELLLSDDNWTNSAKERLGAAMAPLM